MAPERRALLVGASVPHSRRRSCARLLRALHRVFEATTLPDQPEQTVLARTREALGADVASLLLMVDGRLVPQLTVGAGHAAASAPTALVEVEDAVTVAATGRGRVISNLHWHSHGGGGRLSRRRTRGAVLAPLAGPDGVTGVVCVAGSRAKQFGRDDLELLTLIGAWIAVRMERVEADRGAHAAIVALADSERRARAVLDSVVNGVLTVDARGAVLSANRAACDMFGYALRDLLGRDVSELVPDDLQDRHRHLVGRFPLGAGTHVIGRNRRVFGRRRDGSEFPVEIVLTALEVSGERQVCVTVRDVTEVVEFERRLRQQSLHDPLTGLGNRALFNDRMQLALSRIRRHGGLVGVVLCDLDDFKGVNDRFGHGAGDRLLVEVAARLREAVRPEDTVARLGGDEFAVVCEELPDEAVAERVAHRIVERVRRPAHLEHAEVTPAVSVGVAVAGDSRHADELLANADMALYAAKAAGRNRAARYNPAMRAHLVGQAELRADLPQALQRGELEVHYQPLVDLTGLTVTGAEALVRWRHPRLGLLQPAAFLPAALDSELAIDLDQYVLARSHADLTVASRQSGRTLELWVNMTARTLGSPALPDLIPATGSDEAASRPRLTLEVPETALMDDLPTTSRALARLRGRGIGVAIDDFGSGHTSLAYLTQLPIHAVKLDQTLVRDVAEDSASQAVVDAVTTLARALRLVAVAEGLETPQQVRAVAAHGCQRGQGFALGTPETLDQFLDTICRPLPLSLQTE